jgi:uncharacterized protein DUF6928
MGAKTWMLVYAESSAREALATRPELDRDASLRLANRLFAGEKLTELGEGDLLSTAPPKNELHIGCFAGVSIVAAKEFGLDHPSALPQTFLDAGGAGKVYLHAMHSVVDWFAFAVWSNGILKRSLSLSPDSGILEDVGEHFAFEAPFWSGQHPAVDDEEDSYPFPFHPLELGEATLNELFGYSIEGFSGAPAPSLEAELVPLIRYKRSSSRSAWKFW